VVFSLDHRIEAVTGYSVDTLRTHRERGVLDATHAELADRYRELADTERSVTFYRTRLHRLSSGEVTVDEALLRRIERTVGQLREAADVRDAAARLVLAVLEPIEAGARTVGAAASEALSTADQAALLAIASGAKLHQHLVTGRLSVTTASGARITYAALQRLQGAGLVDLDTTHPVHAGQPITLTDAGRVALTAHRRPHQTPAPKPVPRPGAWPVGPGTRH
jgi:hypothetical protein